MLTLTDLFAGAGGSSTGAISVPGVEVRLAANHWDKAVEVHNANHPGADHLCADISAYDPRRVPATDLLWASPECTNHSQAKGQKRADLHPDIFGETLPDEAAERSRSTMWDVPRFAEAHGYEAIIVENVVEAAKWIPFRAWLDAMHAYGYDHQIVCLNSMHAQAGGLPAPQSRDRMYVVFWKRGNRRPDLEAMQRPRAFCPSCQTVVESVQSWKKPGNTVGRYRQQYVYRCPDHACRGRIVEPGWLPAAAAIDWSLPGKRIGDRDKPLADKTRARIAAGIARYWQPVAQALAVPVEGREGKEARTLTEALRTLTTRSETAMAYPPFLTQFRDRVRDLDPAREPLPTVVSDGANHGLVTPFIAELRGGSSDARSITEALATVTASGNHHGLVTPYYGTADTAKPTGEALGTLTTVDRYALVMRNNSGGAEMSTPVHEVMRTLTTGGHQSVVTPGDIAAADAQVDDCLFRMLEPHEVARGMAFPDQYIWQGTRRERVRMAGNAVTPPAARDLVAAVAESLA